MTYMISLEYKCWCLIVVIIPQDRIREAFQLLDELLTSHERDEQII